MHAVQVLDLRLRLLALREIGGNTHHAANDPAALRVNRKCARADPTDFAIRTYDAVLQLALHGHPAGILLDLAVQSLNILRMDRIGPRHRRCATVGPGTAPD